MSLCNCTQAVATSHVDAKEQYSKALKDERTVLIGEESKADVFKVVLKRTMF